MSLLIVYGEEKVKTDTKGNNYNSGAYSSEIWNLCYKKLDDNITFMSRHDDKDYTIQEANSKFNRIPDNIKYKELKSNTQNIYSFFSPTFKKSIKQQIENEVINNDTIVARVPSEYSYYAIDFALKHNKNLIVEVVGCSRDSMWYHSTIGKILAIPCYLRQKKYIHKSPNVIYVTDEFLQSRYPTDGNSIGCSDVCLDEFKEEIILNKIQKYKDIKGKKVVLGTCGAINVAYKGQQYVIQAISQLKQQGIEIEYQIVGGGDPKRIIELANKFDVIDQVKIIGSLEHDKVFQWLSNSVDIYVQPSDTEGLSRALLEAISVGCACIASDVGGNSEIINKLFTFPKSNYKVLSNIIKEFIDNSDMLISVSQKNYEYSKKYRKTKLFNQRIEFYKKCIGEYNE